MHGASPESDPHSAHEEETRHSNDERLILIEIGRALASPEALQDARFVYRIIYEQVRRLMPVDTFFVCRYTCASDELAWDFQVIAGREILAQARHAPPPPLGLKALFSFEQQQFIFRTRTEYENYLSAKLPDVYQAYLQQPVLPEPESMLLATIRYGSEDLGILGIQSNEPHSYQQKHMQLLRDIIVLAAAAIKSIRIQEELRVTRLKAQEAERLTNRFLMTASHELRTPLTAVHGYLEMLDEMTPLLDMDLQARFIANARRASEELVLIVSTLMDASRLDQDKVELRPEAVKLIGPVLETVEILHPLLNKETRVVTVHIPEQMYIWADDLRLRQILLNLLNNALKYTPPGTPVTISAEALEYTDLYQRFATVEQVTMLLAERHYALITVHDQGPGIAPEQQSHLFTKFTRLNEAMNSLQRGAGLGLYLCRQFSEAMGGAIWLESNGIPGDGCTFRLVLPLVETPTQSDLSNLNQAGTPPPRD